MNDFGIPEKSYNLITKGLLEDENIDKAVVFGSRAIGNYKNGSDIDIALFGKNINQNTIIKLSMLLNEELPIPYFIDILDYKNIKNIALKEHIDNFGKLLYQK